MRLMQQVQHSSQRFFFIWGDTKKTEIFSKDYRRGSILIGGNDFRADGHIADSVIIAAAMEAFKSRGISEEQALNAIRNYKQPYCFFSVKPLFW